jgi:TctA family transporter
LRLLTDKQNTFDQDSNSVNSFWRIIGSVTTSLAVLGILILYLVSKKRSSVHKVAMKLFGRSDTYDEDKDEEKAKSPVKKKG